MSVGMLPTVGQLEEAYFERQRAAIEAGKDAAAYARMVAAEGAEKTRELVDGMAELSNEEKARRFGPGLTALFAKWLRDGDPRLVAKAGQVAETVSKASLVEDAAGQVLIPADITVDILNLARESGLIRDLATVRPTVRNKQRAGLLSAAATGWGRLETGTAATDANVLPANPGQEIEVHDLVSLAKIGADELSDTPEAARAAIVDAIGSAIADSEDNAFAAGTGSGQPAGLALAANVARVPAGQKITAAASATPVAADILALPWKLPTRYRAGGVWLMSEDAAPKVAALTFTNGDALMPNPGAGVGPLGWPLRVVPGLPAMSTAGSTDASVWFINLRAAYRVVDRGRMTVQRLTQRFAEVGMVGMLVRHRVGGDLVRPDAAAVYLL